MFRKLFYSKIPRHTFFQGGVQFFSDYLDRLQSSQEVEQKIANNWFFWPKKSPRGITQNFPNRWIKGINIGHHRVISLSLNIYDYEQKLDIILNKN